ncbi:unnamed protein product [Orchesella dallaii]|uniref:Transmembrane protein n=1 Tax=Orchesella dallaii TaxID=48710 RepID=A0ABP1S2U2_9HEXA
MELLEDDPWARKRTVATLAIIDILLAFLLIGYAGARLLRYNFTDQTVVYVLYSEESVFLSMVYWLTVFTFLSLQVVLAFFLLTATNDMTTDPETMIDKCYWWRILSQVFFFCLTMDLLFILYDNLINGRKLKEVRAALDTVEVIFRGYGIYFIGKFMSDLQGLFHSPIVQYDKNGTPIPPTPPLKAKRSIPMDDRHKDIENYM